MSLQFWLQVDRRLELRPSRAVYHRVLRSLLKKTPLACSTSLIHMLHSAIPTAHYRCPESVPVALTPSSCFVCICTELKCTVNASMLQCYSVLYSIYLTSYSMMCSMCVHVCMRDFPLLLNNFGTRAIHEPVYSATIYSEILCRTCQKHHRLF